MSYEQYTKVLDSVGESILAWADPENKFRGFTEVSASCGSAHHCTMIVSQTVADVAHQPSHTRVFFLRDGL